MKEFEILFTRKRADNSPLLIFRLSTEEFHIPMNDNAIIYSQANLSKCELEELIDCLVHVYEKMED